VRLAFFVLQFLFILLIACHDSFSIFSSSSTVFPKTLDPFWNRAEAAVDIPLGYNLSATNPLRQILWAYLNTTGINAGYSYFAPNVPDNYKLVFELHYPDGNTEFELPEVSGRATGLRLATLLDVMAETQYEPLRTMMVKMVTYAVWEKHPGAVKIKAVLGYVDLPTPSEFRRGQKESYHFLFAYDFDFASPQPDDR
jgi:hypothetical protein